MTLINKFERSCDTFGKKEKANVIHDIWSVCPKILFFNLILKTMTMCIGCKHNNSNILKTY